jgi:amino acid permease
MMKTQIGLGVLSIPVAFDALGVVPGVICLIVIAGITTWSDYIIGTFKLRHREVYGIDDVGELLMGRPGRYMLGAAFCLCKLAFGLPLTIVSLLTSLQGGSLWPALACWVSPLV